MADEARKRSRFDQTEAPRKSRFDRRSRSPPRGEAADSSRHSRSRSPVSKSIESPPAAGDAAAAAAAAAAAKINAQIQAKKGIQHVHVPPIRSAQSPSAAPAAAKSPSQPATSGTLNDEIYTQDGDFIKDIEVNDLRNRYTLTKGSTQKMIKEKTGADVTTRGNYYPDKSMATAANPPLYLHVTSTTKDGLEKAVAEIEELMQHELPTLIDERRFRRRDAPGEGEQRPPPPPFERDALGRRKWPEERIPIDLEPIPGFNLRAQVVGAGGSYVKHIQQETRCRVQIKGRGSGFMEHDTGRESDESMFLHVAGPDPNEVQRAKEMCLDLLKSVKDSYHAFKERGPRGGGGRDSYSSGGGHGGGHDGDDRGHYRDRDRQRNSGSYGGSSQYGGGYGAQTPAYSPAVPAAGYGGAQSPSQFQGASAAGQQPLMTPEQMQAWAQYYAANPSLDPYASYGGFGTVMAAYMQGQTQPQQLAAGYGYQGIQANGMGNGAPPPPPPPDDGQVPPPPPLGTGGSNGYSAVPPPPGM